jgi:hypothetical protein
LKDAQEERINGEIRFLFFYLDVESLVMTALAATVGDVILRQLHADQILHDHLGVVVVVVMMMVIIIVIDVVVVVVVVVIVLVDQPAVSD